jgi:hypothetical protein
VCVVERDRQAARPANWFFGFALLLADTHLSRGGAAR